MESEQQTALLEGLLRQYSPTGQEEQAVSFLVNQMKSLGMEAQADEIGNAVGWRGSGPNEIVLLGHIDTVKGEIEVRREGNLMWGRGSVDAKGPLACFTAAAAQVIPPADWRVTVIGAVGEEGDSKGAAFIRGRHKPQYCVIGEPSSWDHITLGYKGSAWGEYNLTRPLAHTAAWHETASEGALHFWNRFEGLKEEFNQGRERAFEQLTSSLRTMNTRDDGFYESASLRFNLRLPPDLTPQQAIQLLQGLADEGDVRLIDGVECYRADKNNALVRAFLSSIRAQGGKPGFYLKTGTSDMNLVGPAWQCPILAYGPGDSGLDHTPQEHIQVDEYLTSIQVLVNVLQKLMTENLSE